MYSNLKQNLIRAVRVLPEAVRVGAADGGREREETREEEHEEEHVDELGSAQEKISLLQSQIGLLNNRLKETAVRYDELMVRCENMEHELANRETELQAEMQKKLDGERGKVINEAKADAAKILADAEKIRAKASEKGHAEGLEKSAETFEQKLKEGLEKAVADTQKEYSDRFSGLVASMEKTKSEVESNLAELARLNEARLLRLWQGTLTAMLNREVEINPDTARIVLEGVLERVSDRNRLLIYLSPADIDQIQSSTDKMTEHLRGAKHLEFLSDPHVDRGSCIVETNLGIYDARWRTQMEQIEGQIADLYHDERTSL